MSATHVKSIDKMKSTKVCLFGALLLVNVFSSSFAERAGPHSPAHQSSTAHHSPEEEIENVVQLASHLVEEGHGPELEEKLTEVGLFSENSSTTDPYEGQYGGMEDPHGEDEYDEEEEMRETRQPSTGTGRKAQGKKQSAKGNNRRGAAGNRQTAKRQRKTNNRNLRQKNNRGNGRS